MIEANPRASRTVPFVSKATGLPLAKIACRVMLGERLADMDLPDDPAATTSRSRRRCCRSTASPAPTRCSGPRCARRRGDGRRATSRPRSPRRRPRRAAAATGRCSSPSPTPTRRRSARSRAAARPRLRSPRRRDGGAIARMGIPVERLNKLGEGSPHVVDKIEGGDVVLVINTPTGTAARGRLRDPARGDRRGIPCITTMAGGMARRGRSPLRATAAEVVAAGDPPGERPGRVVSDSRPRSRRSGGAACRSSRGARRRLRRALGRRRRTGRRPIPASSRCSPLRERWGGGADERPFLPRAFSVARRHADGTLDFVLEDVGPGTERLRELDAGDEVWLLGPLGRGFAPPRDGAGRSWSAAASGSRRSRSGRTRCGADAVAARVPRRRARRGRGAAARRAVATDDGSRRPPRPRDRAARGGAAATRPARRGLRLRAAADARGGAGAVRRARRPGAARAGVRHGVRVRRLLRLRRADARRLRPAVRRRAGARRRGARVLRS